MADFRYDKQKDVFERVEQLPSDAMDKQIALWQAQIDAKLFEIQGLQALIDSLVPLKSQRDAVLASKDLSVEIQP